MCAVHDVPTWVIRKWGFRTTYIGQGELLAGPLALALMKSIMNGIYSTWFVDKQAALTALINTSSATTDNSSMTLVFGLMVALM